MSRAPFSDAREVLVVLPTTHPAMNDIDRQRIVDLPELLSRAGAALARELGAPVRVVDRAPEGQARWLIGPAFANPALAGEPASDVGTLRLDRRRRLLVTDGPDLGAVYETFGQLRALGRMGDGVHRVEDLDLAGAIRTLREEVADSWPSFGLRGVDWRATCARWEPRAAREGLPALRRWVAELGDAHTAIRSRTPLHRVPLEVAVTVTEAVVGWVPPESAAHAAGVRPGWRLLGEDLATAWETTGATPHQRPWLAGRRMLEGPPGERPMEARAPDGRRVAWVETRVDPLAGPMVEARRTASGATLIRVKTWLPRVTSELDDVRHITDGSDRWIVDLRGNGGGHLMTATAFRDRFLRERTLLGTMRTTEPGGALGPEEQLWGEPGPRPFRGRVRFLVDALTYSSSEDVLLGLQGLPHVQVLGTPTGGGSGRVRVLRYLPDTTLTISTALTWDRRRRCVEGQGLAPDVQVAPDPTGARDAALERADTW
ncbi:MAG: hypothetical protein H6735_00220 [Alphaproteobacteria bacterium]|nr:hypothetical protein [Alphaproteobacteria bacterium]